MSLKLSEDVSLFTGLCFLLWEGHLLLRQTDTERTWEPNKLFESSMLMWQKAGAGCVKIKAQLQEGTDFLALLLLG